MPSLERRWGDGQIILAEIKAAILKVERNPVSFVSNGEEPLAKANKFAAAMDSPRAPLAEVQGMTTIDRS